MLGYQFSLSDVVNGAIGGAILLMFARFGIPKVMEALRYILKLPGRRRRTNYSELLARVRSDEYYRARLHGENGNLIILYGLATQGLILSFLGGVSQYAISLLLIVILGVVTCASGVLFLRDVMLNGKAMRVRMRLERRRKAPPRQYIVKYRDAPQGDSGA